MRLRPAATQSRSIPLNSHPIALTTVEPIETIELSTSSSVQGQLCSDDDSSSVQPDETRARVRGLGIPLDGLYERFRCVLPHHDHFARIQFTKPGKYWMYYCDGPSTGLGLGEVRAMVAYGEDREISPLEAARWRELLDFEVRLREPVALAVDLPEECPDNARRVASQMRLFVGLRDVRFPLDEAFVFASDFAQAYCSLSEHEVRSGKGWLERAGVIRRVGKNGLAILWRLAAQDPAAPSSHRGPVP